MNGPFVADASVAVARIHLELAQRLNLPLGCKEGALRLAAQACGDEVW